MATRVKSSRTYREVVEVNYAWMRRDSAYHEAAHAAHALAVGWKVLYVSIETEGQPELSNYCLIRRPKSTEYVPFEAAVNSTVGSRAGWWQDLGRAKQEPFEEFVKETEEEIEAVETGELEGGSDDIEVLWALRQLSELETVDGQHLFGDMEQCYYDLCREAENFIWEFWPGIEAVADALQEHGILRDEEVARTFWSAQE